MKIKTPPAVMNALLRLVLFICLVIAGQSYATTTAVVYGYEVSVFQAGVENLNNNGLINPSGCCSNSSSRDSQDLAPARAFFVSLADFDVPKGVGFTQKQLDKKFKHASDFGITSTKKTPETLAQFKEKRTLSDLIYLQILSGILQENGRISLRDDVTIVPVGGMEKVSTFVSLLRGSKLDIACLLDSSIDASSKSKLDHLIKEKIIQKKKIRFFDEFIPNSSEADIEDLFTKDDYLSLFNESFKEHSDIKVSDLNSGISRIVLQLNMYLNVDRYNHYRPANTLAKSGIEISRFSTDTVSNFENMFAEINSMFPDKNG